MRRSYPPGPDDGLFGLRLVKRLRREPLAFAVEVGRRYGDLASFRLGPYRAYVLNHPACVQEVLVTKARSFRKLPAVMRALRPVDGDGVVMRDGEAWLRQRRRLQPAFRTSCLEELAGLVVGLTREMLDHWPQTGEMDVARAMVRLVLAVLTRAWFGVDLPMDRAEAVCDAVAILSETLIADMGQPFRLPEWLAHVGQAAQAPSPSDPEWVLRGERQPVAACGGVWGYSPPPAPLRRPGS
jgi:cytochrome P450